MLVLTLAVGEGRYAIDVRGVTQVVPRISLRPAPHMPTHVAGLLNHGGEVVPIVDLGLLLGEGPCALRLSTRIILVSYDDRLGRRFRLGLIAERVTELRDAPLKADETGASGTGYFGRWLVMEDGLFQLLHVDRILPEGWETGPGAQGGGP